MLIVEPYEMRLMARELESPEFDTAHTKLTEIHSNARVNGHNNVTVPKYWAPVVLSHVQGMIILFPQIKFGSIHEYKNKLRMFTIPSHGPVELLKIRLYNDIDTLMLKTVDRLAKGDTKPVFLR